MGKKTLYLMCGPAGSGKTTWVRQNAEAGTSAHISRDRIRFEKVRPDEYYFSREGEVYDEFVRQTVQALKAPWVDAVYADATHLTKKARHKFVLSIDEYCDFELVAIVVMPDVETCLAQNAQRTGRECVPESVIRNMYNSFQSPLGDDLRYEIIIVNDEVVYGKVDE